MRRSARAIVSAGGATVAAVAGWVMAPAVAAADWTPVVGPTVAGYVFERALAVAPAGDVAAVWVQQGRVRAAVKAPGRRLAVRTLFRHPVQGLTAVMDRRGELTVAWVDQATRRGPDGRRITIRAMYRTPTGRWSSPQAVSRTSLRAYAFPRLAAAPDRSIALSFNASISAVPGAGVAWRSAGRRFGTVQALAGRARRTSTAFLDEPTLTVDPSDGRVYLAGVARCNDEQRSAGILFSTTSRARRFGASRTITARPATRVRFAITGRRAAAVTWIGAGCSTSQDLSGPVRARVMRAGVLSEPVVLDPGLSRDPIAAGLGGGRAEIGWQSYVPDDNGRIMAARIAADGTVTQPAAAPPDGWSTIALDGAGNQLVERLENGSSPSVAAVGVRPAGGGSVERAPLAEGSRSSRASAVAPTGSAIAAARWDRSSLQISVWRPSTASR